MIRLAIALLAVLAFASCATVNVTRWPHVDATYECQAVECPSPTETENVAAAFVVAWREVFGELCDLDGVHVSWEPYIAEHILGQYWPLADVIRVRVHPYSPRSIANTAYPHELAHMCLKKTKGDADTDHAEGLGPWTSDVEVFVVLFEGWLRDNGKKL